MAEDDHSERDRLLLYGVGGLAGYYLVVRPLLKKIGINPADQAAVDAQNALSPADNPFSAQYTSGSKKDTGYWNAVKANYDENPSPDNPNLNVGGNSLYLIASLAEGITKQFGYYSFSLAPDFNAILGYFNNIIASKQELSDLTAYIQANFNLDLWSLLENGVPVPLLGIVFPSLNTGLSAGQLAQILAITNKYPDINSDSYALITDSQ